MFPSHVWSAANVTGANKPAEPNARLLDGKGSRNWVVRNVSWLKSFMRIILGFVWLIDGYLKFSPGLVDSFPALIKSEGQPAWLQPWFNFGPVSHRPTLPRSSIVSELWRWFLARRSSWVSCE